MPKQNFIKTSDIPTAELLKNCGYQEINSGVDEIFMFINDTTLKFSNEIDISKIQYSNKLFV